MSEYKGVEINGEIVGADECMKLIKMLCNDAKQIAGEFHGMNRSIKFRTNWPSEDKFAEMNWKNFVEPCRMLYAERLGDPNCHPEDARKMHLALVLQDMMASGNETDNRLQISRDSQQFYGDKKENLNIVDKFGPGQNLRAALMNSVASTKH